MDQFLRGKWLGKKPYAKPNQELQKGAKKTISLQL